jgi:hypothetical protein
MHDAICRTVVSSSAALRLLYWQSSNKMQSFNIISPILDEHVLSKFVHHQKLLTYSRVVLDCLYPIRNIQLKSTVFRRHAYILQLIFE